MSDGRPLRAVLVDDTPDVRLLVRTALERSGRFAVVGEAGDGETGTRVVAATRPDVVLLDLAMPHLDGLEALPAIRRAAPAATVVVLSGFESTAMLRQVLRAGAHGYLQKGADPRELVAGLLRLAGAPAPAPPPPGPRSVPDVLDAAPFGVVVLEPAAAGAPGRVREANPAARELLGDDPDGAPWRTVAAAAATHRQALLERGRVAVVVQGVGGPLAVTLVPLGSAVAAYLAPGADGRDPATVDSGAWLRSAVAGAAHEIRNPTVVIAGAVAELTRTDPPVPEHVRHELLGALARQARLLDRATGDLLTAANAHRGGVRVEPAPLELAAALHAAAADSPAPSVLVDCPSGLRVRADPVRLQQMLLNLLGNAAKYGAPPVSVTAREEGTHVRIGVHDAGPGVPEAFRPALFEEFSRAPGTRPPGTGLGLFVVRALALAQGGSVWFEPGENGGATFGFTLPAARRVDSGRHRVAAAEVRA